MVLLARNLFWAEKNSISLKYLKLTHTYPNKCLIIGYLPVHSKIGTRVPAIGTNRVCLSVSRMVSPKPGRSTNISRLPFLGPVK